MNFLETVYIGSDRNLRDFRFPVQFVNRPISTSEVSVAPSLRYDPARRRDHGLAKPRDD